MEMTREEELMLVAAAESVEAIFTTDITDTQLLTHTEIVELEYDLFRRKPYTEEIDDESLILIADEAEKRFKINEIVYELEDDTPIILSQMGYIYCNEYVDFVQFYLDYSEFLQFEIDCMERQKRIVSKKNKIYLYRFLKYKFKIF